MIFSKKEFPRAKDLTFRTYGKWTTTNVVERVHNGTAFQMWWMSECSCKRTKKLVLGADLVRGTSKQCKLCRLDVIKNANSTIDGDSKKTSEYHGIFISHYNMNNRCSKPKDKSYKHYGAKGITVCDEWKNYITFKKWSIANGWKKGLVISRNGDIGNYEPNNAVWKTRTENNIEAHLGKPRLGRKLNREDVLKIRTRYDTYKNMANDFGIRAGTISDILGGRTYADI